MVDATAQDMQTGTFLNTECLLKRCEDMLVWPAVALGQVLNSSWSFLNAALSVYLSCKAACLSFHCKRQEWSNTHNRTSWAYSIVEDCYSMTRVSAGSVREATNFPVCRHPRIDSWFARPLSEVVSSSDVWRNLPKVFEAGFLGFIKRFLPNCRSFVRMCELRILKHRGRVWSISLDVWDSLLTTECHALIECLNHVLILP